MAELTKITSPLVPRENIGNRFKPDTDQAFGLNDPSKVHKPAQDGKISDRQPDNQTLRDSMGRASIQAVLKDSGNLVENLKRMALLIEAGVSASDSADDPAMKELLKSLFQSPRQLMDSILEQDRAAVLFKGEAFNVLRDILGRFDGNPKVRNAIANLLKVYEHNVNTESSIRSILLSCENLLGYMYTRDREQFADYLDGLARMLLPQDEAPGGTAGRPQAEQAREADTAGRQTAVNPQTQEAEGEAGRREVQGRAQEAYDAEGEPVRQNARGEQPPQTARQAGEMPERAQGQTGAPGQAAGEARQERVAEQNGQQQRQSAPPQMSPREAAQILKGNLLPLLGEIVVKYHQNTRIRDHVMAVVHNIVRVDQGTPEALREAVRQLVQNLRQVVNVPENFAQNLLNAIGESGEQAKDSRNNFMESLTQIISETLRSEDSPPAALRQAENLLISMLQNQSSMMNVLHFVLPLETPNDQIFAEMYVDPDSGENNGKEGGGNTKKIFLSFETQNHGSFELSFLQTGEHVDFSMWCPGKLVQGLSGLRRHFADVMQTHGYTMDSFRIEELRRPQGIADVFPKLLERRMGIDVRI